MKIKKYEDSNIMKKFCFLIFIIFISFFIFPNFAGAQQADSRIGFSVFPPKVDLELKPGEIYNGQIRLYNQNDFSLQIKRETTYFSATGERGEMSFSQEPEDVSFDARQWIRFEKEQFILDAGQFQELNFSINVPENAETGGYYLVSFFQADPMLVREESPVKITAKIGVLFLLNIIGETGKFPPLEKQFELLEANIPSFVELGPIPISFRLKNNDPTHIKVGGKLVIYDIFKRLKEEIEIREETILPGKIRFFEVETKNDKFFDRFFLGPYQVELILSTKTWREKIGHDHQMVKNFKFFALPYKPVSLIIIFVLSIIIISSLIKKRKKINK